ncbi:MAG: type II toxin-antitoxin system prevent-host-death family antitoxin [Desulfotomaculales bacterium]
MEEFVGIDQLRPRLGEYVERAEKGEVVIISSRSKPKGVLLGYPFYEELKRLAEKARQMELKSILDDLRQRAEEAGIDEEDVFKEIEEARGCGR